jgi:tetratricopeptide (TPR) repeat protein
MPLSIHQKQNYIYFGLIVLTIVASILSYRITQKKWLLYREAENKFSEKSFKEAIALYQESLKMGNTTAHTFLHLADSYTAIRNFPEAIKYYNLYLDVYPQDSNVRLLFARTLSWNGNIKEAEEQYQKILKDSYEIHSTD